MKRIYTLLTVLMFGWATLSYANPASALPQRQPQQHLTKSGKPDKRYNENKHLKKDGTPDMRYKSSKKSTAKVSKKK